MAECCATCRFWDISFEGGRPLNAPNAISHGQCLAAMQVWDNEIAVNKTTAMLAVDGSQYMAILMTLPSHLCKEYSENEC